MQPVLILGAGINGCAVARDLILNGVPVWIVDTGDISRGATSRSSRLIHGGLRYLEYRDTALVRESLREREILLRVAPQFVRPLRLRIPVAGYGGGLLAGAGRFTGFHRVAPSLVSSLSSRRGLIAVRAGLQMYDWLSGESSLPGHDVHRTGTRTTDAGVDPARFPWICEYSDAQMLYPERFILAFLHDARLASLESDVDFKVLPHHRALPARDGLFQVVPAADPASPAHSKDGRPREIRPSFIVNATGAWGDRTNQSLGLNQTPLFAGTKGSHLFTRQPALCDAVGELGVYAEARDGRLVFVLPVADGVLIGTTDDPFDESPEEAIATRSEVEYLLELVNQVFPSVDLTADQIESHQAGVRPLPRTGGGPASAIPRGHSLHETTLNNIPLMTLIGGKLTTCRALAAEVSGQVLRRLGRTRQIDTDSRPVPGAESFPVRPEDFEKRLESEARNGPLNADQLRQVWMLAGNFTEVLSAISQTNPQAGPESIPGTSIPLEFARWSLRTEWVSCLSDLVERRLMLVFQPEISASTLQTLAGLMVSESLLDQEDVEREIQHTVDQLSHYYGRQVNGMLPRVSHSAS